MEPDPILGVLVLTVLGAAGLVAARLRAAGRLGGTARGDDGGKATESDGDARHHVTDDDCERMRRHLRKSPSQRSPDDLLPADDADGDADGRDR